MNKKSVLDEIQNRKHKAGIPAKKEKSQDNNRAKIVIECFERIPCNPCETICNKNVIKVGDDITNLPVVISPDECTLCGKCIRVCPGLAIFIVNESFSDNEASITMPYEILPLPEKGDDIIGINRDGEDVCEGKVLKAIKNREGNEKTSIVTIIIPKEYVNNVRHFRRKAN